ncbi:MAG: PD-(D/E)XK nuclease family protein [Paludibacteraceae bacterium]|nr:PD-(D/E)XK nuclease family protein [Paludibacteraceae bacterium]
MGNQSENQSKRQGIVLNRMYAGSYLSSNLGHEVINMYQADNGHYYLYLNHHGAFAKEHVGKIEKMILVKYYSEGVVEVVGVARVLKDVYDPREKSVDYLQILPNQEKFIKDENISYGGKCILEIFKGSDYQNVFITYKAKKIWRRKSDKRLFICFSDKKLEGLDSIEVKANQAKTSLKQYFYSDTDDFNALEKIFEDVDKEEFWEVVGKVDVGKERDKQEVSLFDICQIQYDENCYSNALAYFIQKYLGLWKEFFAEKGVYIDKIDTITREETIKGKNYGGRLDICIRYVDKEQKKNIIIIENKIKSGINTIGSDGDDGNQLTRYWEYAKGVVGGDESRIHAFILAPDYNIPKLSEDKEKWSIIKYSELYEFLETKLDVFKEDVNIKHFFYALKRHTYENVNDTLYYEMQEKFFNRINQLVEKKEENYD